MSSNPPPQRPPRTDRHQTDRALAAHDTPGPGLATHSGVELKPGARPVPDYELVQRLGRGGFGEVWKAIGPGGVAVALKFIRLDEKAGAIEQRSLDLIRDIRHPNLLALFGSWQRDGFLILALELGEGTLLDRLAQAQAAGTPGIPPGELLDHMRDAARGLDYLNGQGIQHRDVKPHNFLLVGGGVKVADFGLAKLLQHTLTSNTGSLTPAYAAPEFFNGQTSSLSDQYSLAVTYCQLRGGRLPFEGSPTELMMGHVIREPDLTMLPQSERTAVARALAKKSPERWPNCQTFVRALAAAVEGCTPTPDGLQPQPFPSGHQKAGPSDRVDNTSRQEPCQGPAKPRRGAPPGEVRARPGAAPVTAVEVHIQSRPRGTFPRLKRVVGFGFLAVRRIIGVVLLIWGIRHLSTDVQTILRDPNLSEPSGLGVSRAVGSFVFGLMILILGLMLLRRRKPVQKLDELCAATPKPVTAAPQDRTTVRPDHSFRTLPSQRPAKRKDWILGVLVTLTLSSLLTGVGMWGLTRPSVGDPAAPGPMFQDRLPEADAKLQGDRPPAPGATNAPPKPPPAVLQLQPVAAVRLDAGQSQTVTVRIQRENYKGPVELRVEGLPPGITARPGVVQADNEEGHIDLTAAATAASVEGAVVRVEALATETKTQGTFRLTVVRRPPPPSLPVAALHLRPIPAVRLEAGQNQTVTVRLQRENCKGPIDLSVEVLPPGVTARPGVVWANEEEGHIELTAAANAGNAEGPVRLIAAAAGVREERDFRLTVVRRPAEPAKELLNSIGMPLVLIPPGRFKMGSPQSEADRRTDEEQHDVEITKPFYLGQHAVTRGQFRKFIAATNYLTEAERDKRGGGYDADKKVLTFPVVGRYWLETGFDQTDEHPVVNVSWNDAQAFCDWLSKRENKKYRLPTEAEWEYSCRARTTTRFHSGDAEESLRRVANIADRSLKSKWDYASGVSNKTAQKMISDWFDRVSWDDGYPFTAPVGRFEPNGFGLYDMHGNVFQWCQDRYDRDYYKNSPTCDPQGPEEGLFQVVRGGAYSRPPADCRAACRHRYRPATRLFQLGFRVVLVR
jgi:formylglycine-generating enzyme required for sulfatase activity